MTKTYTPQRFTRQPCNPKATTAKGLNKALLPDPIEYLQARGYTLKGRGVWREMVCPFHDDSKPSLRIDIQKGCFKCMACEAKGGDLIAFHQKLTGRNFVEACKDLGAWEAER